MLVSIVLYGWWWWCWWFIVHCFLQMVKMMITVVIIYALCWLPLHTITLVGDRHESIWQVEYIQVKHSLHLTIEKHALAIGEWVFGVSAIVTTHQRRSKIKIIVVFVYRRSPCDHYRSIQTSSLGYPSPPLSPPGTCSNMFTWAPPDPALQTSSDLFTWGNPIPHGPVQTCSLGHAQPQPRRPVQFCSFGHLPAPSHPRPIEMCSLGKRMLGLHFKGILVMVHVNRF